MPNGLLSVSQGERQHAEVCAPRARATLPAVPATSTRSLPPLAWAGIFGGVLLAFVLVALLAIQLGVLADSRDHIESQDRKISALYRGAQPAVHQAEPLVRAARPLVLGAVPLVRAARTALTALDGSRALLGDAAAALPPLMRVTQALAANALPLVHDLQAAGAAHVVAGADDLLAQLRAQDLIARASRSAALTPELVRLQRRLLAIQMTTLRVQRQSRAIQQRTLEVQLRALAAIESLDRKTGGRFPPVPAARTPGR